MFGVVGGGAWLQNCGFWELSLVGDSTLDEGCIYHMCGYITYYGGFWEFSLVWGYGGYITYDSVFWEFSLVTNGWFCKWL